MYGQITYQLGFYLSYDPCVLKTKLKNKGFQKSLTLKLMPLVPKTRSNSAVKFSVVAPTLTLADDPGWDGGWSAPPSPPPQGSASCIKSPPSLDTALSVCGKCTRHGFLQVLGKPSVKILQVSRVFHLPSLLRF